MPKIRDIPEIAALDAPRAMIRIAPELDVPVTDRVRRIIDTAEFRRLAQVSQLGLVSLVYPGAVHNRFEHSLGVYRLALLFLRQLAGDERFTATIEPAASELFLVAALLHDVGHWGFCHPIEDMRLAGVPHHEAFARQFLLEGELAGVLADDWNLAPGDVASLLSDKPSRPATRVLSSMLAGPIDVDKMDYLARDSLHAGVPYGRNFDQGRLIGSLCLNEAGDALAITDKGKTAAEMMVFARYVMFSEVYWHHGVRAATAMLQRAVYLLHRQIDPQQLFRRSEPAMVAELRRIAAMSPAGELLDGLFGAHRRLYKRVTQCSWFENRAWFDRLAGQPYPWLLECAERFAALAAKKLARPVAGHEVLFDAPPAQREIEFHVEVYFAKQRCYRPLGEVSPVVRTLAREQFDDYVKRVRLFAHPRIAGELAELANLDSLVGEAIHP
ncbi:MAG TPA: HD domain-containing protein [Pirellulales bacterium]|jgi:HD superfamily phosphohydrolase|nr:HD domain-containing protein [Pirellulales bacterium]